MLSPRLNKALAALGILEHDFDEWEQFALVHDDSLVYIAKRDVPRAKLLTDDGYWTIVCNVHNVEGIVYGNDI